MGVTIRKEKRSGNWYVCIVQDGQRAARKCPSEQKALELRDEVLKAMTTSQFDISKLKQQKAKPTKDEKSASPTLAEFYERFEKTYLQTAVRQGTRDAYENSFAHILPELGSIPMNEIDADRIETFVAHLVAKRFTHRKKVRHYPDPEKKRKPFFTWIEEERPLSKSTLHIILSELCKMFSYAVEKKVIATNPALRTGKHYSKVTKDVREDIEVLNAEEVAVFLNSVRQHSSEFYPLFLCALHTGMRSGELAGLRWDDIDFHGKFFLLRRQITKRRVEKTKTNKKRRVDMSDDLAAELSALKKRRQAEYLAMGKNEIPESVFMSRGRLLKGGKRGVAKPIDMKNVKDRHFAKCLSKAGLRQIRFHDLRHTYATLLLMQGVTPVYVKEQLGHSSIKVTVDTYGHWIPSSNRDAVNKLPSIANLKAKTEAASG
jgi:integrase